MTREERKRAINALKISAPIMVVTQKEFNDYVQTLNKVMDWLEQETCDDCISRDEAIRVAEQGQIQGYEWQFKKLCKLPSVTPQSKIGRWYNTAIQGEIDGQIVKSFVCSECSAISVFRMAGGEIVNGDLCPKCGAKMMEEKE